MVFFVDPVLLRGFLSGCSSRLIVGKVAVLMTIQSDWIDMKVASSYAVPILHIMFGNYRPGLCSLPCCLTHRLDISR